MRELADKELLFYREQFFTLSNLVDCVRDLSANGAEKDFNENEEAFRSDDEDAVNTYVRTIYDHIAEVDAVLKVA
jgi:hypothetical protein